MTESNRSRTSVRDLRTMRPKHRQFLSYLLLATYAGISLLGDGLHMLLPEGGNIHHHHGIYVVGHSCHDDPRSADHDHDAFACGCSEECR